MKKQLVIIPIATILLVTVFVAGCTTGEFDYGPSSSTQNPLENTTSTPTPKPVVVKVTVTVTATPTPMPKARIPTEIHENKWVSMAMSNGIVRGQEYSMGWVISVLGHVNDHRVCGQWANFYIDDQLAGGKWVKWDYVSGGGLYCVASVGLSLSSADTAKLSLGMHTLKVDYLGDDTYAPSQWASAFVVRNP